MFIQQFSFYGGTEPVAQAKAEYGSYYKNSLLYLACVDIIKDLTAEDRLNRAHDLGVAAFLGDQIYNFGELVRLASIWTHVLLPDCFQLMHPILDDLDQSEYDWIKKLLFTFNEGNIGKFEALAPLFPKEVRDPTLV